MSIIIRDSSPAVIQTAAQQLRKKKAKRREGKYLNKKEQSWKGGCQRGTGKEEETEADMPRKRKRKGKDKPGELSSSRSWVKQHLCRCSLLPLLFLFTFPLLLFFFISLFFWSNELSSSRPTERIWHFFASSSYSVFLFFFIFTQSNGGGKRKRLWVRVFLFLRNLKNYH